MVIVLMLILALLLVLFVIKIFNLLKFNNVNILYSGFGLRSSCVR